MISIHPYYDLKKSNSFGLGISCRSFISFDYPEELINIHKYLTAEPMLVLGGGTNILFSGDFHGTIVHPSNSSIEVIRDDGDEIWVTTGAGLVWDHFVQWCTDHGYGGLENLSGIPGHVGAAPVQNIGAYGTEVSEYIEKIEGFDPLTMSPRQIQGSEAKFGYRYSIFKEDPFRKLIITRVTFRLHRKWSPNLSYRDLEIEFQRKGHPTIKEVREAVIRIRNRKLPDPLIFGNAGSFFKNPVIPEHQYQFLQNRYPEIPGHQVQDHLIKLSAAWLIERAGWKGYREGNVGVFQHQPLVLITYENAEGGELIRLAEKIRESVFNQFGIRLEEEVTII